MKQLTKEEFIKHALEHPEKCIDGRTEDWPVYVNKGKTVKIYCPEYLKNKGEKSNK